MSPFVRRKYFAKLLTEFKARRIPSHEGITLLYKFYKVNNERTRRLLQPPPHRQGILQGQRDPHQEELPHLRPITALRLEPITQNQTPITAITQHQTPHPNHHHREVKALPLR